MVAPAYNSRMSTAESAPAVLSEIPTVAHTPNEAGRWHLLADHLRGTASLAMAFAGWLGAAELGHAAGLLHDHGKAPEAPFQAYLRCCAELGDAVARSRFPRRDHKALGAVLAMRGDERFGIFLAMVVLGHHGGLGDFSEAKGRLEEVLHDPSLEGKLAEAVGRLGEALVPGPAPLPSWVDEARTDLRGLLDMELLYRMVFSCLVDADFLDTEAHFRPEEGNARQPERGLGGLLERFEVRGQGQLAARADTPVNQARRQLYDQALARAECEPGLYRLAAPTGAGKTLVGLGWALHHARCHGLRRVVTAVPFITVTDQVAGVYRQFLDAGDDTVLEHHSQVAEDSGWSRLAAENWDAPVVVTTTVQLFESLFSNRTSRCRKLHRLAKSVIIVDEVQAIPLEVLEPVVDALWALVERFGASVLLMTATQPAFEHVSAAEGRPVEDVVPTALAFSPAFARSSIEVLPQPLAVAEVGRRVSQESQCLCIVNTVRDARAVTSSAGEGVLHLSTMLRPADRKARLAKIHSLLSQGQPCRVVTTQLVEAGIDLDFPLVLRAMAPLASIAQADGRCNRNGTREAKGRTVVFELEGGGSPPGAYYGRGRAHTRVMLARPEVDDLRAPEVVAEWYRLLLNDPAVDRDAHRVQDARRCLSYRKTAERFRLIDDDLVSVVVPWPDGDARRGPLEAVLADLADRRPVGPGRARQLQEATVSLRPRVARQAVESGSARSVTEHLLRWDGPYDDQIGVMFDSPSHKEVVW